jgi:hypothetical protein
MYYIRLNQKEEDEDEELGYHCRNCGTEDDMIDTQNVCISSVEMKAQSGDCRYLVNEYTKFDPALPKTNKIKCPNTSCKQYTADDRITSESKDDDNDYTVIYIRYDEQALKYIYMCELCDTVWKSNNKI